MTYRVEILADSTASGVRLTTVQAAYPRIIHSELLTHRTFSRNAASSRAIPVERSIERVLANTFVPEAFARNAKGMQGGEALDELEQKEAELIWLNARNHAVQEAKRLVATGVHKHWANRILEPYAWITTIITATEWENFFALRCHPAAAPEFQKIAGMIRDAMKASTPEKLDDGGWHLPMVQPEEMSLPDQHLVKLSVARCARVSYLTHEGKRDVNADLALYEKLLTSGHLSPFEHAARVATKEDSKRGGYYSVLDATWIPPGNFRWPWIQHRKDLEGEAVFRG